MQSKSSNPSIMLGMLVLLNIMVIGIIRPFNLVGIIVMNLAAIVLFPVFLRVFMRFRGAP